MWSVTLSASPWRQAGGADTPRMWWQQLERASTCYWGHWGAGIRGWSLGGLLLGVGVLAGKL